MKHPTNCIALTLCLLLCSTLTTTNSLQLSQPQKHTKELFSVAPMVAHTHRHYRYMFRQISHRSHLYTEMIPANQIVQAFEAAALKILPRTRQLSFDADEIMEVVEILHQQGHHHELLHELLSFEDPTNSGNIHLQLGGNNPEALGKAAAIGAAYGYSSINLNCGCPSNAVSGRAGGAALMRTPDLVAQCVEQISHGIDIISQDTYLSVKHRLGVRDMATYDAEADRAKSDEEAYNECSHFLSTITQAGHVQRVHCHARIALLGDVAPSAEENLWVPPTSGDNSSVENNSSDEQIKVKVNHKRVQYQAKRNARLSTMDNRSVPPLRPNVVNELSRDFPSLEFVTNGGMRNLDQVRERVGSLHGAMVGRGVINHPCSFATADDLWGSDTATNKDVTRGQVLLDYIDYCGREEEHLKSLNLPGNRLSNYRRRLVGAPFHLFAGEDGSNAYQRRLRKLASRAQRHTANAMLAAAMAELSPSALSKSIRDHTPADQIESYEFVKRAGPLQRSIH